MPPASATAAADYEYRQPEPAAEGGGMDDYDGASSDSTINDVHSSDFQTRSVPSPTTMDSTLCAALIGYGQTETRLGIATQYRGAFDHADFDDSKCHDATLHR